MTQEYNLPRFPREEFLMELDQLKVAIDLAPITEALIASLEKYMNIKVGDSAAAIWDRVKTKLRSSTALSDMAVNSIPQMVWMTDETGAIVWYNQRCYDYSGKTFDEAGGWRWQSLHDPDHLPRVMETYKAALAKGEAWEDTYPLRRHDGEMVWHLSRADLCRIKWEILRGGLEVIQILRTSEKLKVS